LALKDADFSVAELKAAGFTPGSVSPTPSWSGLRATVADFKAAGFTAAQLWEANYTISDLQGASQLL
jgi:uncharacterized protein YjbI with pentapeptide repeats